MVWIYANIYRPAVLFPCFDRSANFGKAYQQNTIAGNRRRRGVDGIDVVNEEEKITTSYIRMWGIPYKTIDRAGYDMTFPALPGNALYMPDQDINAIYDNIGEEEMPDVDQELF